MNIISDDKFTKKHTPEQTVLAVNDAARRLELQIVFKSAGITDVEELEAMCFCHNQINCILQTINNTTKKKHVSIDNIKSYKQLVYSAMAPSPESSNRTKKSYLLFLE